MWKADVLRFPGAEKCCVKLMEELARQFEDCQFFSSLGHPPKPVLNT